MDLLIERERARGPCVEVDDAGSRAHRVHHERAAPIGRRDDGGGIPRQIDHDGGRVVQRHEAQSVPPPTDHEERVVTRYEGGRHRLLGHGDDPLGRQGLIDLQHPEDVHLPVVGPERDDAAGPRHEHGRRTGPDRGGCQRQAGVDVERDDRIVVGIRHEGEGAITEVGKSDRTG